MDRSVTIVTGGACGIGTAISRRMLKEGDVILVGRTRRHLEALRDERMADGPPYAHIVAGDVADPMTATHVAVECRHHGYRHVRLVSNAGIGKSEATHSFDPMMWKRIFDVNVHGAFHLVQALLPLMLERDGGAICFMSSLAGLRGLSHDAAYVASKHALVGFAKALGKEYGARGIHTVALCPGFVESAMTDRSVASLARRHGSDLEEARRRIERASPLRRVLTQEEVAETVAFVTSPMGAAFNGTAIDMSGGQ